MSSSVLPNPYIYRIQHLTAAFSDRGYPVSRTWIYRQESKGNLIMPRSTTNFKKAQGVRKAGAVRVFTKQQMEDIVDAFIPGGCGYYDYRKE